MRIAFAFLLALTLLAAPPVAAQSPAPATPQAIPMPAPIHVGALTAWKYGSGKKTLVLLPGLGCGAWVWDATVAALQSKYTIYTVTFAGFDGTQPVKPPYLPAFAEAVRSLIQAQKMQKPILVGHSIGGDIAFMVGIADSSALSGILAVDSLPIFPPLQPGETLASRGTNAKQMGAGLLNQSADEYAAGTREAVGMMVTNPATAAGIASRSLSSDRATVAGSAAELASTNLAQDLPKITVPVLVLAAASAYGPEATAGFYRAQYAGAPTVTVRAIPNSRHFIMYDQPAAFLAALTTFVDGLN
jgi:pimeloyl-ACP methyl ester carboxylesterase